MALPLPMIGLERAPKGIVMGDFAVKSKIWVWLLLASIFLSGCSIISDDIFSSEPSQPLGQQVDNWVDTTGNWLVWDANDPKNELVTWSRGEDAIQIKFSAGAELNSFSQRAHTLSVKVIQLSNVSGLNSLIQTPNGIAQVLSQPVEMIPDGLSSALYTLAPTNVVTYSLAREENAKYIAVVTGFAELIKTQTVRIIPISVSVQEQAPIDQKWTISDYATLGVFMEKESQPEAVRPSNIKLDVRLGEEAITQFSASAS